MGVSSHLACICGAHPGFSSVNKGHGELSPQFLSGMKPLRGGP